MEFGRIDTLHELLDETDVVLCSLTASDDDASLRLQGLATNSWKTLLESGEIELHPLSFGIQEGVSIDLGTAQRLVLDGNSIMFFHLEDDLAGTLHSRGVDSE